MNCNDFPLEHLPVVDEVLFSEFRVQAHPVKKLMLSLSSPVNTVVITLGVDMQWCFVHSLSHASSSSSVPMGSGNQGV